MNWAMSYVGLPFDVTRRKGEDCWSLVCKVYANELGIELPQHGEIAATELMTVARTMKQSSVRSPWLLVFPPPQPFDIVLMSGLSAKAAGVPVHVGLAVTHSLMLHTSQDTQSSVIVPLNSLMVRSRIKGFYRHERLPTYPGRS